MHLDAGTHIPKYAELALRMSSREPKTDEPDYKPLMNERKEAKKGIMMDQRQWRHVQLKSY